MIDWTTLAVPFRHVACITDGRTLVVDESGVVKFLRKHGRSLEGSYSAKVLVYPSNTQADTLIVSGNPSKFLQGHNVFGTDDIRSLTVEFLVQIWALLDIAPSESEQAAWWRGGIDLHRVDINYSWRMRTRQQCRSAVQCLGTYAHLRHRGRASVVNEGTAYFGKGSRRSTLKFYVKGDEIEKKGHRIHDDLPLRDEIAQHADCLLRGELCLRRMELERLHLGSLDRWDADTAKRLFVDRIGKLEISEAEIMKTEDIDAMAANVRADYELWSKGVDLREIYKKRTTFYRHRAALLRYGVDIAVVRKVTESNVIPLRQKFQMEPVGVPEWAIGTAAYWEPRKFG